MTYSNSFHHGSEIVFGHNIRDENHQEEKHIDPNGLHETWIDEPIEKAYVRIFGDSLAEYNSKQKRSDRKIKSYLQNVRKNSKLKPAYEFITQVGNEKTHPDIETSKTILKEYLADFRKRNPGLEVIGAYFHADEIGGCPHLHTDYIPVASGNKTGLKVRNNLNSALKKLGYETEFTADKKMISAEMKFQTAERKALSEICKNHGIEIENPQKKDYCSSAQLREARDLRIENDKKEKELKKAEESNSRTQTVLKIWADELKIQNETNKTEKKRLQDVENRLLVRSNQLDAKELVLAEKAAENDRKGEIIKNYMQTAQNNSMEFYQEYENFKKNPFRVMIDNVFKKAEKAITGAWSLVHSLQVKVKELEKSAVLLKNWREHTSSSDFRKIADDMDRENCQNYADFDRKQKSKQRRSSWSRK